MIGAIPSADPGKQSPVTPGDVVAGKYRIERVLAVGGMGVVVEAHHLQLDERVAIKFLQPDALKNQEAVERFATEARAAARIKSEHVARVVDVGALDAGGPFMVMEFLEGEDLAARLERVSCLGAREAVNLILEASEAIAEAHANGIVHRDLKPANLFLSARPDGTTSLKVLDFGISKLDRRHKLVNADLTAVDAILGSPLYMAPEQMRAAREADARSDVWALGAILYEMIVGKPAFEAPTEHEICRRIFNDEPANIVELRPAVSLDLERAILRALEKELAKRYKNVAEFANAIAAHGSSGARLSLDRIHGVLNRAGIVTGGVAKSPDPRATAPQAQPAPPHSDGAAAPSARDSAAVSMAAATQLARRTTPAAWGDAPQGKQRRSPILWGLGIGAVGAALVTWYLATSVAVDTASTTPAPSSSSHEAAAAASGAPGSTHAPTATAASAPPAVSAAAPSPSVAASDAPRAPEPQPEPEPTPQPAATSKRHHPVAAPAPDPTPRAAPTAPAPKPPSTPPNPAGLFDEQK